MPPRVPEKAAGREAACGEGLQQRKEVLADLAVEAIGEEAEVAAGAAEVDDVQHLVGGAGEGDAVAVGRHDVGLALDADGLVLAAAERGAGGGDRLRGREL